MKKSVIIMTVVLLLQSINAQAVISPEAESKIIDYYDLRLQMTQFESVEQGLSYLCNYEKSVDDLIKEKAVDYNLESAILSNLSAIEYYTLLFDDESYRKGLNEIMHTRTLKGLAILDSLSAKENAHPMLYTATAETLSRYMFSSVSAVLKYGFRTKKLWEHSLSLDSKNVLALVDLGQWYYFAPFFFGGSSRKAKKLFESAWKNAETDGEKYYAALYLSQFYLEKKKLEEARLFLNVAEDICPESREVQLVKQLNQDGISYLKYNRNRSKLDEQRAAMSDEDLKKGVTY